MTTVSPLAGLTVVELGHNVAAPFCGVILATLGATVIKIENPDGGDPTRDWGPPFVEDVAVLFSALNTGKRGAALDLRLASVRAELKRHILEHADVVVQNLKPGSTETFGLDCATLTAAKPELVYCNLSAFGSVGPLKDKPGYDPLMQAFAGMMDVTGEEGRSPVRVGVSLIDMGAGMWSAIGILSALIERAETGRGGVVNTSLFETALSLMSLPAASFMASGVLPRKHGSGAAQIVPYQVFETADRPLMVAAGNDRLFGKLCAALNRADLATVYPTNRLRVEQRTVLTAEIQRALTGKTAARWSEILDDVGVPNSPLQNIQQVVASAQTEALQIIQTPPGGTARVIGLPISFGGKRPLPRTCAPALGEFNSEISAARVN